MQFKHLALLAHTVVFLGACKKEEDSGTSALTNQNLACYDYSQAAYQALRAEVATAPNFFNNFSAADQNSLYKHFGAVPQSYRKYLIDLRKAGTFNGIFKKDLGAGGVMGVCSSTNRGPREIGLTSRHSNAISFAMIHEVGHAVEGMIQRKTGKNNRDWEATLRDLMTEASAYNKAGGISRAQRELRDYAFASDAEFFAEAFHNYYCSPDTHKFISAKLPKTYAFLQTVLDKPVFMGGNTPAPTPTPTPMPTPTPNPTPSPDDKGEELAQKHVDAIQAAYNKKSTKCNLDVRSVKMVEADGDFVFDMAVQRIDGQVLPAVRLRTNYKLPLASEMNDLKTLIPRSFAGCPAE